MSFTEHVAEVGDWVKYLDEEGHEVISEVTNVEGWTLYTKHTGKYWIPRADILELRKMVD